MAKLTTTVIRRMFVAGAMSVVVGCSRPLTAAEARYKADQYVASQFSITNMKFYNVDVAEDPKEWLVTYTARGERTGGRLKIGVDKHGGKIRLISLSQ